MPIQRTLGMVLCVTLVVLNFINCSSRKSTTSEITNNPEPSVSTDKLLTLYTSLGANVYNPLAEAFQNDTGLKVDVVFGSTGDMLKRIEAEGSTPQGDVMLGGGAELYEAYRGVFEPYQIKEDSDIPSNLKAKDYLWYAHNTLPMVIAYNKNLVKESDLPSGWKDLLDPKWRGKIVMADPSKSGISYTQVLAILTIFGKDSEQGWKVLTGIVKNSNLVDSSTLVSRGVNDGEYALALTAENAAWKYIKAGGPVGLIYPVEGTALMFDSVAVVKGSKHRQNARAFVDWLCSKKAHILLAKLGLRPARPDVAIAGLPSVDKLKLVWIDQTWASSQRKTILKTFQDIKGN